MNNEIVTYLSKYIEVSKELEEAIHSSNFIRTYKKGSVLLSEGDISNECYFIIKGCVRTYYMKNGDDITVDFHTENQSVTPSNYGQNSPSKYFFECIEDVIAGVGTPEIEQDFFQKFPQLESLTRALVEAIMLKQQDVLAAFKMATAEERYIHLRNTQPDLLQRVPQHQIASYLGIKPESLSRLKARIARKK